MLEDPEFLDEAPETGYRLCSLGEPPSLSPFHPRIVRAVPGRGGWIALCGVNGGLRLVRPASGEARAYQVHLGAIPSPFDDAPRGGAARSIHRPKPVNLAWTGLALVPGRDRGLFLLLGETDTVMYTTMPPETADAQGASSMFAYGSRLIPLEKHKSRVRVVGVDPTGTTLASADEDGYMRLWPLATRGGNTSAFLKVGGLLTVRDAAPPRWTQIKAHSGPVLTLSHGEATRLEEGQVVTGGLDRSVRVWSWRLDDAKGLEVRPIRALVTESCEVVSVDALSSSTLAGTDRGTVYLWSSGTGNLQSVVMSGQSAVLCVAASQGDGPLYVSGDEEGMVRLYRQKDANAGPALWQLVAECPLDAAVVGSLFHRKRTRGHLDDAAEEEEGEGEEELVVVSAEGLVRCWAVSELPHTPEEALQSLAATSQGTTTRKEEEEEERRQTAAAGGGGGHEETKQSAPPRPQPQVTVQEAAPSFPQADLNVAAEEEEEEEERARPLPPGPTRLPAAMERTTAPVAPSGRCLMSTQQSPDDGGGRGGPGAQFAAESTQAAQRSKAAAAEEEEEEEGPRVAGPPQPTPLPTQAAAAAVTVTGVPPPPPVAPLAAQPPAPASQPQQPRGRAVVKRPAPSRASTSREAKAGGLDTEGGVLASYEPCVLQAPALNSTALVVAAIEAAERAEFRPPTINSNQPGGDDLDTESVLEEAAKAVNVDRRRAVFQGLAGVADVAPAPGPVVRKQVQPQWLAKLQDQRPTADDFWTPGLQTAGGGGGSRPAIRLRAPQTVVQQTGSLAERARAAAAELGGPVQPKEAALSCIRTYRNAV